MNPFVYPALLVLCVCSIMTWRINKINSGGDASTAFLNVVPLVSIWMIAACMLASVGLAATTGTGARGAVVATVLVACVWCVWASSSEKFEEAQEAE